MCLGPFDPALAKYDSTCTLPTKLAGASVSFDQTPAPLISTQAGEIWGVVPATIAGKSSNVTIRFDGGGVQTGVQVLSAEPGIFVQGGSTTRQALAINQGNLNSAARGSILTFWATGQVSTRPLFIDGNPRPQLRCCSLYSLSPSPSVDKPDVVAALAPGFAGLLQ